MTVRQYNLLERAIARRLRVVVHRRGAELVIRPRALVLRGGREVSETVQPATGDAMTIYLDEIEAFEIVDE